MNYCMMSYTMSRYPDFNIRDTVEFASKLGMKAIDICFPDSTMKAGISEIRKICDDNGIKVAAHTFGNEANGVDIGTWLDKLKKELEKTAILGAPVVMVVTPGRSDVSPKENRQNWIGKFSKGIELAAEYKVAFTIENFPGIESPFVTSDDILEAIKEAPGLKVTYDNGNSASGENPAEGFKKIAKHVVHAHFKDWDILSAQEEGYRKMKDGMYYRPALIGEGAVNQRACLKAMKECGYQGFINIEYEGSKYNGHDAVRKALEFLRAAEREI